MNLKETQSILSFRVKARDLLGLRDGQDFSSPVGFSEWQSSGIAQFRFKLINIFRIRRPEVSRQKTFLISHIKVGWFIPSGLSNISTSLFSLFNLWILFLDPLTPVNNHSKIKMISINLPWMVLRHLPLNLTSTKVTETPEQSYMTNLFFCWQYQSKTTING